MGNVLEFLMKLTDTLSPAMRQAASVAESSASRIQASIDRSSASTKTFSYSLTQLKERLDRINSTRMNTHIPDVFRTATREANKLERQIERLEQKGKSMGPSLSGIISSAVLFRSGSDVIRTGVEQQGIARAINFTTGGRGSDAASYIHKQSNDLGLNEQAQLEGFKTLSGGLRGLNFDLDKQLSIISGVNAGIATYNLQGEQSKRVYLALGQIASKGTVQAEELRGQIGEVLPGAFSIAAKAMGVTEQALNKMMEKGDLMSRDFLPRFALQMQKEFGQSAIDASTGAAANMNRFDNTLLQIKKTFAEDLLPPFLKFMNVLRGALEWIGANKDIVLPLIAGIGGVILITQAWGVAQNIVNNIMKANPIILIISLLITIGLWVNNLIKKYDGWGTSIKAIWDIIKAFFWFNVAVWKSIGENIWYGIQWAWLKVRGFFEWIGMALTNVWDSLVALINLDFKGAKDALFREIVTPASIELEALEKKHKANQEGYKRDMMQNVQTMVNAYGKIGLKKKPTGVDPTTENAASANNKFSSNAYNSSSTEKATNINSGGQRSIVVNIGKQVEKLEVNSVNVKEGIEEISKMVREEFRRMLYSINGMATN